MLPHQENYLHVLFENPNFVPKLKGSKSFQNSSFSTTKIARSLKTNQIWEAKAKIPIVSDVLDICSQNHRFAYLGQHLPVYFMVSKCFRTSTRVWNATPWALQTIFRFSITNPLKIKQHEIGNFLEQDRLEIQRICFCNQRNLCEKH